MPLKKWESSESIGAPPVMAKSAFGPKIVRIFLYTTCS